jgi:hypothetical protein
MSKYRVTLTSKPGAIATGTVVTLCKEPENSFDNEAIRVELNGVKVGFIAAFYKIRKPGTVSAGRLVDKIPESIEAVVVADQVAEVEVA